MFPTRDCQALEKSKRKYSAFKGVFCWEHSPKTFTHVVLVALVSLSGDNECTEIVFITLKKKSLGDEQTAPWLRTHIALWAERLWFSAPISGSSQFMFRHTYH